MSEQKTEKAIIKQLPCGGYAILGVDTKNKTAVQTGYIGKDLPLEGFFPNGYTVQQ